jgi:hypothetical protein
MAKVHLFKLIAMRPATACDSKGIKNILDLLMQYGGEIDAFLLSDQVAESFNGMFKLFFSVNVEYPTIDPFFNQT